MGELEERDIRNYVMSQSAPDQDDEVTLVQKVGRRRVMGSTYDLYDVHMSSDERLWVITNPTNCYGQEEFKSIDQVFTYHIGLSAVLHEQFKVEPDESQTEYVSKPWRRYARAVDAMIEAKEAEDFQAVGIRCREALLALGREYMDADWVHVPEERPKDGDAKGWMLAYADSLTTGRRRSYVKALAEQTWDLSVWLQHYTEATELDAELVLGGTQHLLRTYTLILVRHEQGLKERCPKCDSYQLVEDDSELIERDGHYGMWLHDVCLSCGWESEKKFEQWSRERLKRLFDYHTGKWSPPKRSMEELEVSSDD